MHMQIGVYVCVYIYTHTYTCVHNMEYVEPAKTEA